MEAKRLLDSASSATCTWSGSSRHDHTPPPDAYIPVSGGLFRDSSIHDFDALRWLTGSEIVEVYATGSVRNFPIFAEYDDVDTGACIFTCENGVIGSHAQTRHNPLGYDVRMEVIGSKDVVCVGLDGRTPIRSLEAGAPVTANPAWDSFLDRFEEAYRLELLEFLRVARGEIESPCTARDAMQAMRIAYMATKSRLEHRPSAWTRCPDPARVPARFSLAGAPRQPPRAPASRGFRVGFVRPSALAGGDLLDRHAATLACGPAGRVHDPLHAPRVAERGNRRAALGDRGHEAAGHVVVLAERVLVRLVDGPAPDPLVEPVGIGSSASRGRSTVRSASAPWIRTPSTRSRLSQSQVDVERALGAVELPGVELPEPRRLVRHGRHVDVPGRPVRELQQDHRRVLGRLERRPVRPRGPGHDRPNTAVTATTSPNSQVAMYDQCDARSPETPAPASPRSNRQM